MKTSKEKGNKYEREIAGKLSLWISEGKNKNLLWRNSSSGARATVSKEKLDNQIGDISSDSKEGHDFVKLFLVECKHYKDIKLENLIWRTDNSNKNILGWWKRYSVDALDNNKILMLICKQNNKEELLFVKKEFIELFEVSLHHIIVELRDLGMYILNLNKFLDAYDFKRVYL